MVPNDSGLAMFVPARPAFRHTPSRLFTLCRRKSNIAPADPIKPKEKFNYNRSSISLFDETDAYASHKRVTAEDLSVYRKPPRKVKMLARDFIHDSLYNPHYGYFPKNAVIFSQDEPFDFTQMKDLTHFTEEVALRYAERGTHNALGEGPGRQIWHTPTELFKPWYGQAVAQAIVSEYLENYFPYEDLIIYEIGAGNGTLAQNILDYIRDEYSEVYERTQYRIIEISKALADAQAERLRPSHSSIEIFNKSIFDWGDPVRAPCFFLALEVIDNFPHDMIRYSLDDLRPYQGLVAIDDQGDFVELYEPVQDPLIRQFLQFRAEARHKSPALSSPFMSSPALRSLYRSLPFAPNMTPTPEFIPTRLLSFVKVLREQFPLHRLLLSDFSSLPDAMKGYNAPVVQTRYRSTMVPVETFMVQPGYFDIFFPTSFEMLRDLYDCVMAKPLGALAMSGEKRPRSGMDVELDETTRKSERASPARLTTDFFTPKGRRQPPGPLGTPAARQLGILSHQDFMHRYANLEATRLRSGENPLLDYYRNVKFLY